MKTLLAAIISFIFVGCGGGNSFTTQVVPSDSDAETDSQQEAALEDSGVIDSADKDSVTDDVIEDIITADASTQDVNNITKPYINNSILWVSADYGPDDLTHIEQIDDLSDDKHDITQMNFNRQPTKIVGGLNGRPTLKFDGINDCLNVGQSKTNPDSFLKFQDGVTVFLLAKINKTDYQQKVFEAAHAVFGPQSSSNTCSTEFSAVNINMFIGTSKNSFTSFAYGVNNSSEAICYSDSTDAGQDTINDGFALYEVVHTPDKFVTFYVNGKQITQGQTNVPNYNSRSNMNIGANGACDNFWFYGEIAELLIYSRAVEPGERIIDEEYFKASWKLNWP